MKFPALCLVTLTCLTFLLISSAQAEILFEGVGPYNSTGASGFQLNIADDSDTGLGTAFDTAGFYDSVSDTVGGGAVSGDLYFGFDLQITATNTSELLDTGIMGMQFYSNDNSSERTMIGKMFWGSDYFAAKGAADADFIRPSDSAMAQLDMETHRFVGKITYNANADDSIVVWMDPVADDGELQGNSIFTATDLAANLDFDTVKLRGWNNPPADPIFGQIDNVIFATELNDVLPASTTVPEPATWAIWTLGLLGMGGYLAWKRRQV